MRIRASCTIWVFYRLRGFSGRSAELNALCQWLLEAHETARPCDQWRAGQRQEHNRDCCRLEDDSSLPGRDHLGGGRGRGQVSHVRHRAKRWDTVLGTTLTRVSEDRWGIGILEQLYRRRRLLILDELSGATDGEIQTLADIIGHLHDSGGQSHILLIDRDISS